MGTVADCYDNAMCASFFATLERELLDRIRFDTRETALIAVFDFIEGWYNVSRRHSGIGYRSPMRYEQLHEEQNRICITGSCPNRRKSAHSKFSCLTVLGSGSAPYL